MFMSDYVITCKCICMNICLYIYIYICSIHCIYVYVCDQLVQSHLVVLDLPAALNAKVSKGWTFANRYQGPNSDSCHKTHMAMGQNLWYRIWVVIHIHLPAILMFTRGTGFWLITIWDAWFTLMFSAKYQGICHDMSGVNKTTSLTWILRQFGDDFPCEPWGLQHKSTCNFQVSSLIGLINPERQGCHDETLRTKPETNSYQIK